MRFPIRARHTCTCPRVPALTATYVLAQAEATSHTLPGDRGHSLHLLSLRCLRWAREEADGTEELSSALE